MLVLFLTGRAAGQVATSLEPGGFLMSFTDRHLIYALPFFAVLAVTIQFILQMNRMIGANVLGYFVAGIYHRLLLTGSAEPHARVLGATVARGRGAARLSTPTRAGTMPAKGDSHARRNGHRLSESRPAAERSRSVPARAEARRSRRAARLSVDLGRRAPFTDYTMCPDVLQKIQQYGTDTVIDYFMNLQVWGTPEQCYGKILDINRRSGNSHYVGVFSYAGMPYEEAEDNLRLFAREVMPELQKLEPQVAAERTERVAVPIEPPVNVGLLGS